MCSARANRRDPGGVAAVELAAILPFFCLILFGQLEYMRLGLTKQMLTIAARDGCRVAVIETKTLSDVQTRVQTTLAGMNTTGLNVTVNQSLNATAAPMGTPITVTVSMPFTKLTGLVPGLPATLTATATMSSERVAP